jgi:hypothetical protein
MRRTSIAGYLMISFVGIVPLAGCETSAGTGSLAVKGV